MLSLIFLIFKSFNKLFIVHNMILRGFVKYSIFFSVHYNQSLKMTTDFKTLFFGLYDHFYDVMLIW